MTQGGRGMTFQLVKLLWIASLTFCFNLEPREKHILSFPGKLIPGREPYFGFSVALLHNSVNNTSWVLVGAPRANSTKHKKIVEPGALFKCLLTSDDCKELVVDSTGNDDHSGDKSFYDYKDFKDHGWLGASLDSQPIYQDKRQAIIVCAPLWKDQLLASEDAIYMNGACYLAHDSTASSLNFVKKVPLVDSREQIGVSLDGNTTYKYGYGQAGFSVHFPSDSKKLIIGTPGVSNWKGSVLLFADKEVPRVVIPKKKRSVQEYRKMFLDPPGPPPTNSVEENDLLGYSLTSGKFLTLNQTLYAAGAPRAAYSVGKVIIFNFASNNFITKEQLKGEQMGEYFGAAVTAADINNDGLDDLVVGSPMYSDNKLNHPDIGRVQTFLSEKNESLRGPHFHYGKNISFARFGTTLASPGDLNADGYADIAVGAPWEGDGALYIFMGSERGLRDQYSQCLSPEDFFPNLGLRGFGMSISRGIDIDNNGYSDLAIGSFISGHVLVIKSRPVVTLFGNIISIPSSVAWKGEATVNIAACINYTGHRAPQNLAVRTKFILDHGSMTLRASFRPNKNSTHTFVESLSVDNNLCRNHQMTVKDDKINPDHPIKMILKYELIDDHNLELIERPMTDPAVKNYIEGEVNIIKGCKNKICRVNMEIQVEFIDGIENYVVIGKVNKLLVNVSNSEEPVYLPTMTVTTDPRLFLHLPLFHDCISHTDDMWTTLICNLSNPISNKKSDIVELGVEVKETQQNMSPVKLQINVGGEGEEQNSGDNTRNMTLKIAAQVTLQLYGTSQEEQVLYKLTDDKKNISTKTAQFNHTYLYEVSKSEPTLLEFVNFTIDIPVGFTNGMDFTKAYDWKPKSPCHLPQAEPVTIEESGAHSSSEILSVSAEKRTDQGILYINCSSRGIKCVHLYCAHNWTVGKQSSQVTVHLDVDLNILAKHMSVMDGAVFGSSATVNINSDNLEIIGKSTTSREIVTPIYPDSLMSKGVPWWVILLAVLGSLGLLGILTYVLYKKGFFKREAMEALKNEQANLERSSEGLINSSHTAE